jgi:hypothetical protein
MFLLCVKGGVQGHPVHTYSLKKVTPPNEKDMYEMKCTFLPSCLDVSICNIGTS